MLLFVLFIILCSYYLMEFPSISRIGCLPVSGRYFFFGYTSTSTHMHATHWMHINRVRFVTMSINLFSSFFHCGVEYLIRKRNIHNKFRTCNGFGYTPLLHRHRTKVKRKRMRSSIIWNAWGGKSDKKNKFHFLWVDEELGNCWYDCFGFLPFRLYFSLLAVVPSTSKTNGNGNRTKYKTSIRKIVLLHIMQYNGREQRKKKKRTWRTKRNK